MNMHLTRACFEALPDRQGSKVWRHGDLFRDTAHPGLVFECIAGDSHHHPLWWAFGVDIVEDPHGSGKKA